MSDHLTDLEQLLLLATLRSGCGSYGAALQEDLRSNAERRVSLGTVYVTMGRLEERGLIASGLGEPTSSRGGKAKRIYTVTEAGRACLERSRAIMDRMWADLPAAERS